MSKVVAYYSPPKGRVQKYLMWEIDFEEAKKSKEGHLWSKTAPEEGVAVDDKTPIEPNLKDQPKADPPPVVDR